MPQLYLKEAEPFLPVNSKLKLEQSIQATFSHEVLKQTIDPKSKKSVSNRSTSLILSDGFLLVVELLQILALIQSMSLLWPYPQSWISHANFIFLFNFDVWEFVKVQSSAFTRVQGRGTPSTNIPINYNFILLGWGLVLVFLFVCFLFTYFRFLRKESSNILVHIARLERAFLFTTQILTFPVGTVVFRLFQCSEDKMTVFNSRTCFHSIYWLYFVFAIIFIILLFVIFPLWLTWRIRRQKLASTSDHHELFLQLKEAEYMSGLDMIWAIQGFHLFSSFTLRALYYKPIAHMVKLTILIIFSAGYSVIYNQAVALAVILSLLTLVLIIIRPYRVTSFNVVLIFSFFCLSGDAIFGALMTSVTSATVESPWLVEPYSLAILIAVNSLLIISVAVWLCYLVSKHFCCSSYFPNDPIWPVMTSYKYEVQGMETYKFMAAVLQGRAILDACIRSPNVFAPVHKLAGQIELVNACCREAEHSRDGTHSTLLHLLNDMTDVYRRLEPLSLFSETVKPSIRENAANFVELMPSFCHRLAQRDYDFILVHPAKKRILLKLSIIAMFINNSKRQKRNSLTQNGLQKIWSELPDLLENKDELEYRENLYPSTKLGPDVNKVWGAGIVERPITLMELDDSDEEESLANFLSRIPSALTVQENCRENSVSAISDTKQINAGGESSEADTVPASSVKTITVSSGFTNPAFEHLDEATNQKTETAENPKDKENIEMEKEAESNA